MHIFIESYDLSRGPGGGGWWEAGRSRICQTRGWNYFVQRGTRLLVNITQPTFIESMCTREMWRAGEWWEEEGSSQIVPSLTHTVTNRPTDRTTFFLPGFIYLCGIAWTVVGQRFKQNTQNKGTSMLRPLCNGICVVVFEANISLLFLLLPSPSPFNNSGHMNVCLIKKLFADTPPTDDPLLLPILLPKRPLFLLSNTHTHTHRNRPVIDILQAIGWFCEQNGHWVDLRLQERWSLGKDVAVRRPKMYVDALDTTRPTPTDAVARRIEGGLSFSYSLHHLIDTCRKISPLCSHETVSGPWRRFLAGVVEKKSNKFSRCSMAERSHESVKEFTEVR